MNNYKFKEEVRFKDNLVFLFLGFGILGLVFFLSKFIYLGELTTEKFIVFSTSIILLVSVTYWLKSIKLNVSINDKRIKFKFSPIDVKSNRIYWKDVKHCKLMKTNYASSWLGNNVHTTREHWYSLNGKNGLLVETKNGKNYFIGCRNIEDLSKTINKLNAPTEA